MARLNRADPAKIAERMGTVQSKSGQFVNIDFNERRIHLLPQQAFIVIASNTSLTEVLEREKALEKKHTEFTSNDAREAFKDNELVKGMVEITRVTGPNSAEARITFHPQELRNPSTRGDQLFNMALSSGAKEHVAFAGIIDLDGDGKPDNENFLAILKRNNLDVDAFLDLKSGVIKGKINPSTQFLIVGTGAPMVGNIKKMVDEANQMKIPVVDSRRFLAVIGVKPPVSPAPPAYTSVTVGGEGSKAPKDQDDVTAPPVVPELKKDEPKKEEEEDKCRVTREHEAGPRVIDPGPLCFSRHSSLVTRYSLLGHFNGPRRHVSLGRLPAEQLPPAPHICVAVEGQDGRRLVLAERHLAAVERLHPAADRLEDCLLPGPGPEKRGRPLGGREGVKPVALPAAEEPADQSVRVRNVAATLHVHPDAGPADRVDGQPVRVRHVEVQRVPRRQVRLAAVRVLDRHGPRVQPQVVPEQRPEPTAGDHKLVAHPAQSESPGPVPLLGGQVRQVVHRVFERGGVDVRLARRDRRPRVVDLAIDHGHAHSVSAW